MAALGYATGKSKVSITLKGGHNLAPKDSNGLSDPFVVITYPGHHVKTPVVKKNLNPNFDFRFEAEVDQLSSFKVHFEVYDKNLIGQVYMGETDLAIPADMANSEPRTLSLALSAQGKHAKDKVSGHLEVVLTVQFSTSDMAAAVVKDSGVEKNLAAAFAALPTPTKTSEPAPIRTTNGQLEDIPHSIPSTGKTPRFGDLGLDSKDQIIIVDEGSGKVTIYDPTGASKITEFPCKTSNPRITVGADDNIYVADADALVPVKKFSPKGDFICDIGKPEPGSKGLSKVRDVFVDDARNRILIISTNGLHFLSLDGTLQKTIPHVRDGGTGNFVALKSVCVNSKGQILLLDGLFKDSVKFMIFDSEGNFISETGTRGEETGNFNFPRDMALDSQDRVYVLDSINNNQDRIQVLDSEGKSLHAAIIGPQEPFCTGITVSKRSGQVYLLGRALRILSPFSA